jgi:hypothetical protein
MNLLCDQVEKTHIFDQQEILGELIEFHEVLVLDQHQQLRHDLFQQHFEQILDEV